MTTRQVPYSGLPVAMNVKSLTGLSECIGIADDQPDGLAIYTTAGAVVLSHTQARVLAGELLARTPGEETVERIARAIFEQDGAYGMSWNDAPTWIRQVYRRFAVAVVQTLRDA